MNWKNLILATNNLIRVEEESGNKKQEKAMKAVTAMNYRNLFASIEEE